VVRRARQVLADPGGRGGPGAEDFRLDIEGLRAVAVLAVVLFHAGLPGLGGGYVGVDVFFVISGFLITGQLWREVSTAGTVRLRRFYGARARRLLPASAAVGVVSMFGSALLLPPLQVQSVSVDGITSALYVSNYRFISSGVKYFGKQNMLSPSPFQHYWSLGVEEQFYVVWPILILGAAWLIRRARRLTSKSEETSWERPYVVALALVTVVSFGLSLVLTYLLPPVAFFSLPTRAWQLAAGGLVALTVVHWRRLPTRPAALAGWAGLAVILLACTQFNGTTSYPGIAALVPTLGALLVIGAGCAGPSRGCGRVLGLAPMRAIGRVSYSWYLWHWPVLVLGVALLGRAASPSERLAMIVISLLLAISSFVLVEQPIRRIDVIVRRPRLGLACGGALVAGALAVVALSGSVMGPLGSTAEAAAPAVGAKHRLTASQLGRDLARGLRTRGVPSNLSPPLRKAEGAKPQIVTNGCHLQHPQRRSRPCVYGDKASRISIVLFGDSHAATWFPALDMIARRSHWRLVDFTKAGCPPAEVNIIYKGRPYSECSVWRRDAKSQIAAIHPFVVITTWARYVDEPEARSLAGVPARYGSPWQDGVAASFGFLRGAAQHTIFISDTPTLGRAVPDCVAGHLSNVRQCTTRRGAATLLPRVKAQELRLAKRERIARIDPTSWFCTRTGCPVIVGNILLYRDRAHMVPAWSRFIAPVLGDAIRRALR
jgi:peptidoglycan/LPS O-acetylase OafA/YrhL